jgi:predicted metal-binding protein
MTTDVLPVPRPRLVVCVTCKAGLEVEGDAPRPGRLLYEALAERCGGEDAAADLMPVDCLSLCDSGCSAAISVDGKWSYLLGGLDAALADDLVTYARAYAGSKTGLVLPSRRPASLATMVKARMPPTG